MKKILAIIVLGFCFTTSQAQEKVKKDIYVQNGDLIEATLYFDNGAVSQTGFFTKEGKLTGDWISYNRAGIKTAEAQYEDGKKVGTWFFWSDDKLTEVDYINSKVAAVNVWKNKQDSEIVNNK